MSRAPRAGLVLAATLAVGTARAEVSQTATARQLAIQGIDLVEKGDCAQGEPLLERAEKLHHAAVHLQYLARCRAREGRLVAATEMWRQIVREGAPPGSSPAVQAAVTEATNELERTLSRLASTVIRTERQYPDLELVLDGAALPTELVGASQVLDPGDHELVARAPGYATWTKRWSLADGQSTEIEIALVEGHSGPSRPDESEKGPGGERGGSALTTVGWIVGAAGGAAVVGGVVTLLSANSRRTALSNACPKNECPPDKFPGTKLEDDKQTIRDLTTATNILLFGGGALLAGGVTLVVLGANSGDGTRSGLSAHAGPGLAGLSFDGRF